MQSCVWFYVWNMLLNIAIRFILGSGLLGFCNDGSSRNDMYDSIKHDKFVLLRCSCITVQCCIALDPLIWVLINLRPLVYSIWHHRFWPDISSTCFHFFQKKVEAISSFHCARRIRFLLEDTQPWLVWSNSHNNSCSHLG